MGGMASMLGGVGVPGVMGLAQDKGIPLGGLGLINQQMGNDQMMGMFGGLMPLMFGMKMFDKLFGEDEKPKEESPENINQAYHSGLDTWKESGGGADSLRALNDWYQKKVGM